MVSSTKTKGPLAMRYFHWWRKFGARPLIAHCDSEPTAGNRARWSSVARARLKEF